MAALCYVQTERLLGTKSRVLRAGVYVNGSYYSEASGYSIFSEITKILRDHGIPDARGMLSSADIS